jgi:hypothetical protein
VAQGDGPLWAKGNPDVSQFSIYGSGHVGIFGSIIRPTDVAGILQLNLLATDFFRDKAWPSFLYYNPYAETKTIHLELGDTAVAVYNTITHTFITRQAKGSYAFTLPARSSAVLVFTPADAKALHKDGKLWVDGIVVDHRF